jgi:hypothetical protein
VISHYMHHASSSQAPSPIFDPYDDPWASLWYAKQAYISGDPSRYDWQSSPNSAQNAGNDPDGGNPVIYLPPPLYPGEVIGDEVVTDTLQLVLNPTVAANTRAAHPQAPAPGTRGSKAPPEVVAHASPKPKPAASKAPTSTASAADSNSSTSGGLGNGDTAGGSTCPGGMLGFQCTASGNLLDPDTGEVHCGPGNSATGSACTPLPVTTGPTPHTDTPNSNGNGCDTYYVLAGVTPVLVHNCDGSVRNEVIEETRATADSNADTVWHKRQSSIISSHSITMEDAMATGHAFVGEGARDVSKGRGIFRSTDGSRGFRVDPQSLAGGHWPDIPHVHLEIFDQAGKPLANNHIPLAGGE